MVFEIWILAGALAAQSLGEVAEKERARRVRNAEAGIEAVAFTDRSVPESEGEERDGAGEPEAPLRVEVRGSYEDDDATFPLEEAHERGKLLEPRMAEIAAMADRVDDLYDRYLRECDGRYLIGEAPPGVGIPFSPSPPLHVQTGRDWFIVLRTPSALTTPVPTGPRGSLVLVEPPQCRSLREDVAVSARTVQSAMHELLERARRERILPGVVRELREKYRLEWTGWG